MFLMSSSLVNMDFSQLFAGLCGTRINFYPECMSQDIPCLSNAGVHLDIKIFSLAIPYNLNVSLMPILFIVAYIIEIAIYLIWGR